MPTSQTGDADQVEAAMQRLDRLLDQAERIAFATEHKRPAEAVRALSAAARIASELQLARVAMAQIEGLREQVEAMRNDRGLKQGTNNFERPEGDVLGRSAISGATVHLPSFGWPTEYQKESGGSDE